MKRATKANTSDQSNRSNNPLIKGKFSIHGSKPKKVFAYVGYNSHALCAYDPDTSIKGTEMSVILDIKSVINALKANKYI